jgi:hypothetical protein
VWHTVWLSALAGLMGANAVPHFVKGMVGEQFPNVWGNDSLRNAVAGTLGFALAFVIGLLGRFAHVCNRRHHECLRRRAANGHIPRSRRCLSPQLRAGSA